MFSTTEPARPIIHKEFLKNSGIFAAYHVELSRLIGLVRIKRTFVPSRAAAKEDRMSTETRTAPAAGPATEAAPPKRSAVEGIKEASRQLRGTIALELAKEADHFPEHDKQLL